MTLIKDSPPDSYDLLTSFPEAMHRLIGIFDAVLFFQAHRLHRQIPMPVENLKTSLLFALEGLLIGIHLLLQRRFIERLVSHSRILEDNGHAEVPTPVFGRVVARLIHPDLGDPPHLHFLLEHWVVIFLE